MKILAVHNGTGSKYYRLVPQMRLLQKLGHDVMLIPHTDKHLRDYVVSADIAIFEMLMADWLYDLAKKNGTKVIFECDDLLHATHKNHYSYKETRGIKGILMYLRIMRIITKCDAVITTNKGLARVYGWFKKTLVFDNYIDTMHWVREKKKNTTKRVRLLWAGSTSHTGDLMSMERVLSKILNKYKNVQFIYVGMGGIKSPDPNARFIYGDDFWRNLPDNRESLLPTPAFAWPYALASLQADLAIAPLDKNYFNKFKSQCKYLEYSINKIPAVYSGWFYTDVEHGKTGFLANNEDEWVEYISRLIENKELREQIGDNAYNDVIENKTSQLHIKRWTDFVLSI